MSELNLRIYHSVTKALSDVSKIVSDRKQIGPLMRGELIEKSFRERLMVVVTSVNRCRYCSYVHSKIALTEGISPEELHALSDGTMERCPEDELPALLYAQHWAESEGKPEPEIHQHILDTYGEENTRAIELSIRLINTANLLGNTFDLVLYKLSLGRIQAKRNPRLGSLK